MPELPEVQTVVSSLASIKGKMIKKCAVYQYKLRIGCIIPKDFIKRVENESIIDVKRVAKYILISLSSDDTVLIHLGMSGNLLLKEKKYKPIKHDHVVIHLGDETIVFYDPRRFGLVAIVKNSELDNYFSNKKIGIDALDDNFNEKYLKNILKHRKTPIKLALLNQEVVAGLGNIYVCEALFIAKINPCTPANTITEKKLKKIIDAVKNTLKKAIKAGGTTLKDYKKTDGTPGYFTQELLVYGKENKPCPNCKTTIKRIILGGRSTFFCPSCQK